VKCVNTHDKTVIEEDINETHCVGVRIYCGRRNRGQTECAFASRDWGWMEELYYRCQPLPKSFEEQTFLSHEIVRRNLLFLLDPRFNVEWYPFKYSVYDFATDNPELTRLCIRQLLKQSYFLHFNGNHADILCCDAAPQNSQSAEDQSVQTSR
jgi:hypothetical protein